MPLEEELLADHDREGYEPERGFGVQGWMEEELFASLHQRCDEAHLRVRRIDASPRPLRSRVMARPGGSFV